MLFTAKNVVILFLEISILIVALFLFPWAFSVKSEYSNPQGLLFFTSENVNQTSEVQVTSFDIAVENVCWQNSSSSVELLLNSLPIIRGQGNGTAYFVFQIPYEIVNLQPISINDEFIDQLSGKMTLSFYPSFSHPDNSYILIEIPEQNLFGHESKITVNFRLWFDWKNLLQETHSDYEIDVPFTSLQTQFLQNIGLPFSPYSQGTILNFGNNSLSILSIAKPSGSTVTQTTPSADHYGLDNNKLWYTWDIKKEITSTSATFTSTSMVIDFQVNQLTQKYESQTNISFLLLGISIPLIVSTSVEILKGKGQES